MGRPRRSSVQTAVEKEEIPEEVTKKRGRAVEKVEESGEKDDQIVERPPSKRGKKSELPLAKKLKLEFRHSRGYGHVLTVGQGDTGQLGLGEDIMEKTRCGLVSGIVDAVDLAAGGMHTAVLDSEGRVWTFGCNDEGSLGRLVDEEGECFKPEKVELPGKIVQISSGDSHTAALSETGQVFIWGTFRDSSGPIGLAEPMSIQKLPVQVMAGEDVVRISSGSDHLVLLTSEGELYSMGNGEQGQLGRVAEMFAHRGGRRGLDFLLNPGQIKVKPSLGRCFSQVWAGSYNTVALTNTGQVVVMGLNNYSQMGVVGSLTFFMPELSSDLSKEKWDCVAMGQHHTLGLASGKVVALGRSEYGMLGLGDGTGDAAIPTSVPGISGPCCEVACGSTVSYAVTETGDCFAWGMGTNGQLGTGNEEDLWSATKVGGKQLEGRIVIAVSSGGQHTVLIAKDK